MWFLQLASTDDLTPEQKEMMNNLHKSCVGETGVSEGKYLNEFFQPLLSRYHSSTFILIKSWVKNLDKLGVWKISRYQFEKHLNFGKKFFVQNTCVEMRGFDTRSDHNNWMDCIKMKNNVCQSQ